MLHIKYTTQQQYEFLQIAKKLSLDEKHSSVSNMNDTQNTETQPQTQGAAKVHKKVKEVVVGHLDILDNCGVEVQHQPRPVLT